MKTALLILNGPSPSASLLKTAAARSDIVVCADGGLKNALSCGVVPRAVIGDMDSRPKALPALPGLAYVCDFDEHRSDFEKSLEWLRGIGCRRVVVSGVRGGRLDHEMINWSVILRWTRRLNLILLDQGFAHHASKGRWPFATRPRQKVSLIADPGGAKITTSGLKYPLKNERLVPGSRGLSNEALSKSFSVTVHSGGAWIVLPLAQNHLEGPRKKK